MSAPPAARPSLAKKLFVVLKSELDQIRPRQHLFGLLSQAIPRDSGNELRASLLRARGIQVGEGTQVRDTPRFTGGEARGFDKFSAGKNCVIGVGCSFEVGDTITLGDRVTIGHQVLIITTTHELGPREHRAGSAVRNPVKIEDGAWIGSRCVILPGVTIGAGAIVDPGSVVNKDVAAHTRVRGIPAKVVEELAK
ncbi:MAG TPA: acyltransferase [Polyangiaceae bacterium]|nr:acyltransferase [Polyangiaceae bacterium]